jgi:hypothetical protein
VALLMAEEALPMVAVALLMAAVALGRVMPAVEMSWLIDRDDFFGEFIFFFKNFWMA